MPGDAARVAATASAHARGSAARGRAPAGRTRPAGSRRRPGDSTTAGRSPRAGMQRRRIGDGAATARRRSRDGRRRRRSVAIACSAAAGIARASSGVTRTKRTRVAGLELAELPQLGCDDRRRADEAAEARAVRAEDDRHVAGEVDGADRRRRCRGCSRGAARPRRRPCAPIAASGRSGARRCGWSCSALPSRVAKNVVDVVGREEVRRAVRAVEHADLPRRARSSGRIASARWPCDARSDEAARDQPQHVAGAQRAAAVAAELAERERRAAAEVLRHVEAAAHREIARAARRPRCARASARLPRGTAHRLPDTAPARRRASASIARAGQRDHGVARRSAASAPVTVISSAAAPSSLPTQAIGEPERERVHRPRRRHADVPVARAGPDSPAPWSACRGFEHFDASARVARTSTGTAWYCCPARNAVVREHLRAGSRDWSRCRRCCVCASAASSFADRVARASAPCTMILASSGS